MPRNPPTADELVDYSHHVLYEMEQLVESVERLTGAALDEKAFPKVIANALLESVGLHARNLIEFLYATPAEARKRDLVIAADFIPSWAESREPISEFLKNVRSRVAREMLHLTNGRSLAEEVRLWTYGKVHNELSEVLGQFIVAVEPSKVAKDFPKRARSAFPVARLRESKWVVASRPVEQDIRHSAPTQTLYPGEGDS